LSAVPLRNGFLSLVVSAHFNESKSLATACFTIGYNANRLHLTTFRKRLSQRIFSSSIRDITNVQLLTHDFSLKHLSHLEEDLKVRKLQPKSAVKVARLSRTANTFL
jgi:hypothetical protein